MRGARSFAGRTFLWLGAGDVVTRALAFFSSVWLARALGAEAYGSVAVAVGVLAYLGRVADFGIESFGTREAARGPASLATHIGELITVRLLVAAVAALAVSGAALLVLPPSEGRLVAAYTLCAFPIALSVRWALLATGRPFVIAMAGAIGSIVTFVSVRLFVASPAHLGRVAFTQLAGDTVAAALMLFLAMPSLWRARIAVSEANLPAGRTFSRAVKLGGRVLPLMLQSILALVMTTADLFFLRASSDGATVGRYAAAYAPVALGLSSSATYAMALLPELSRGRATREMLHALLRGSLWVTVPIALVCTGTAATWVPRLFGASYVEGRGLFMALVWLVPLSAVRAVAWASLVSASRDRTVLGVTALGASADLLLNAVLVPWLGAPGAVAATLGSDILRTSLLVRAAVGANTTHALVAPAPSEYTGTRPCARDRNQEAVTSWVMFWSRSRQDAQAPSAPDT
ncbi:MAG: oligosaccharide flippase family protein [Deltaproteobacteria bacterium]|nr:oligosaccharide flippase family protein [Deltaproteobacteria bacterium]